MLWYCGLCGAKPITAIQTGAVGKELNHECTRINTDEKDKRRIEEMENDGGESQI